MTRVRYVLVLTMIVGCDAGGKPNTLPAAPTVIVTLNGQPCANLGVRLFTTEGNPVGGGSTDDNGRASLRGSDDSTIAPGTYKVTIIDLGESDEDPLAAEARQPKSRVPATHAKPTSSPLTLTIEEQKMEYTLEIGKK
jgi:hypothetical protein